MPPRNCCSVVNSPIVPAGQQLSTASVDQGSQAGDLLGIALLIDRDPKVQTVDDSQRDTVLAALRDTGFITYDDRAPRRGEHRADRHRRTRWATTPVTRAPPSPVSPPGWRRTARAPCWSGRDGSASGTAAVAVARSDAAPDLRGRARSTTSTASPAGSPRCSRWATWSTAVDPASTASARVAVTVRSPSPQYAGDGAYRRSVRRVSRRRCRRRC